MEKGTKKENSLQKKVVAFRLKEEEYEELNRRKNDLNLDTISDYIRAILMNQEVKIRQVYHDDPSKIAILNEMVSQIRMIGINLNQIAHIGNIERQIPENFVRQAEQMLISISRICKTFLTELEKDFELKKRKSDN